MKKQILMGLTLLAVATSAPLAMAAETGGGCGIGKVILEGKTGKSNNLVAAILNNILVPQTFSMTSGLLECDTTKAVSNDQLRETFVASNMDNLSVDVAQGQGDHLATLAGLMGVAESDKATFYSVAQSNYPTLFGTGQASSAEMLSALDQAMLNNADLAKYVR